MKVLVCGGRDFDNVELVRKVFSQTILPFCEGPPEIVIHGGARGADRIAGAVANELGILTAQVNALWDFHGKAAGWVRNKGMLALKPDIVVAFPGGTGTANMIKIAQDAGVEVVIIKESDYE
jgi:hypothetical protein